MNNYQLKVFNSSSTYNSRLQTNVKIKYLSEQLYHIDLCRIENGFDSFQSWVGITNSLNCTTYLDYYISKNMNMLITPHDVHIEHIPHGLINNDLYSIISEDYNFRIEIYNHNVITFQNISSTLVYIITFSLCLKLIVIYFKKIYVIITKCMYKNKMKKKVNKIKYTENMNYKNCTICLEDFELNENLSILSCEHIYHIKCINDWINLKNDMKSVRCPNCNSNIFLDNNEEISEPFI